MFRKVLLAAAFLNSCSFDFCRFHLLLLVFFALYFGSNFRQTCYSFCLSWCPAFCSTFRISSLYEFSKKVDIFYYAIMWCWYAVTICVTIAEVLDLESYLNLPVFKLRGSGRCYLWRLFKLPTVLMFIQFHLLSPFRFSAALIFRSDFSRKFYLYLVENHELLMMLPA